jgi:hypothetical protein
VHSREQFQIHFGIFQHLELLLLHSKNLDHGFAQQVSLKLSILFSLAVVVVVQVLITLVVLAVVVLVDFEQELDYLLLQEIHTQLLLVLVVMEQRRKEVKGRMAQIVNSAR